MSDCHPSMCSVCHKEKHSVRKQCIRHHYSQTAHISLVVQMYVCLYAIITTQIRFFCLSVCMPLLQREILHAPWTPVVTLDLNALLSCNGAGFSYARVLSIFLTWSQTVFICVSTGPLALTKIDFFLSVHHHYSQKAHISLLGQMSVCLYVIIRAEKYVIRTHRHHKAAHFDSKGAHILYR